MEPGSLSDNAASLSAGSRPGVLVSDSTAKATERGTGISTGVLGRGSMDSTGVLLSTRGAGICGRAAAWSRFHTKLSEVSSQQFRAACALLIGAVGRKGLGQRRISTIGAGFGRRRPHRGPNESGRPHYRRVHHRRVRSSPFHQRRISTIGEFPRAPDDLKMGKRFPLSPRPPGDPIISGWWRRGAKRLPSRLTTRFLIENSVR